MNFQNIDQVLREFHKILPKTWIFSIQQQNYLYRIDKNGDRKWEVRKEYSIFIHTPTCNMFVGSLLKEAKEKVLVFLGRHEASSQDYIGE